MDFNHRQMKIQNYLYTLRVNKLKIHNNNNNNNMYKKNIKDNTVIIINLNNNKLIINLNIYI